jgi:Alpha/beta hydrolase domain
MLAGMASFGIIISPCAAATASTQRAESALPVATFSLPPDASGKPFGSTSMDLGAKGYVEEEFFASGKANRYRIKDPLGTAQVVDGGHPYTTRILVRRPTDPKKFNGKVLVEWLNVSTFQDLDMVFAATRAHLLDSGYLWVGVSAQVQGVNGLKTWNAKRYAQLSLAASNDDPLGGKLDLTSDVLSWDAYAQVANAFRTPHGGIDPLGGLKPELIIAAGESQSAQRLSNYYNSIHPLHKRTFDAFFLYDRVIGALRTDLGTKMLSFGSEALGGSAPPPDNDNLRVWEVAGASHVSYDEAFPYLEEQYTRHGVIRAFDGHPYTLTDTFVGCEVLPIYSRVPNGDVLDAGLEALVKWVTVGTPPASAERLLRDEKGRLVRAGEGRVSGGIHLAAYDAPIAKNMGINTGAGFACGLAGSHQDYSPAQLRQLYGTPDNYVARVTAVSQKAVRDGFLLETDAEKTIREAKAVKF